MSAADLRLVENLCFRPLAAALILRSQVERPAPSSEEQLGRVSASLVRVEAAVEDEPRLLTDALLRLSLDAAWLGQLLRLEETPEADLADTLRATEAMGLLTAATPSEWHTPQGILPVLRKTYTHLALAVAELRAYQQGSAPTEYQQRALDEGYSIKDDTAVNAHDVAGRALGLAASLAAQELS